jgi:hypothetical protein
LALRVEGAFVLEVQHAAPLIIERVNAHLGWRCIGKLQIRQGPVRTSRPSKAPKPLPDAQAIESAGRVSEGLADESLRAAMTRLGAAVFSTTQGKDDAKS